VVGGLALLVIVASAGMVASRSQGRRSGP
jgi:hypothetical protein